MKLRDVVWWILNNARNKMGWFDLKDVEKWLEEKKDEKD